MIVTWWQVSFCMEKPEVPIIGGRWVIDKIDFSPHEGVARRIHIGSSQAITDRHSMYGCSSDDDTYVIADVRWRLQMESNSAIKLIANKIAQIVTALWLEAAEQLNCTTT